MAENFTLMDKVIDPKKFTFEEAARIATLEKWRSWFGMGFAEREWNEAFYLMVKGESITLTEFKKEGKKNRIFEDGHDENNKIFCIELQRKLATANIKKILENSKDIKDGLSILGVALRYVAGVEKHNKILTLHWIPKFYNIFKDKRGIVFPVVRQYYHEVEQSQRFLTFDDLNVLNNQTLFESKI